MTTLTSEQSLELYQTLPTVEESKVNYKKNYKYRAEICYEACKDLTNPDIIREIAEREYTFLRNYLSVSSIGTQLSESGYNKLFKQIPLVQNQNAYLETGRTGRSYLKHLFFKYCGLSNKDWEERNNNDNVVERIESDLQLSANNYINVAKALLQMSDHRYKAVGLIALTGRRPHEIMGRAKFEESGKNAVLFEGQGKKKDEDPIFEIDLLISAKDAIKALNWIHNQTYVKQLNKEVQSNNLGDESEQNREIKRRTNKSLNRIVNEFFHGIVPLPENQTDVSCINLRAAYVCIIVAKNAKNKSIAFQIRYASKMLGHVTDEMSSKSSLQRLQTTTGYGTYFVTDEKATVTIKSVKAKATDRLQSKPKSKPKASTKKSKMSNNSEPLNTDLNNKDIDLILQKLASVEAEMSNMKAELSNVKAEKEELKQQLKSTKTSTKTEQKEVKPLKPIVQIDLNYVTNDELFGVQQYDKPLRKKGAKEERLNRALIILQDFNNQFSVNDSFSTKWAINSKTLRELSGCNSVDVRKFMEQFKTVIDDHNNKHSLGEYHNRSHHKDDNVRDLLNYVLNGCDYN